MLSIVQINIFFNVSNKNTAKQNELEQEHGQSLQIRKGHMNHMASLRIDNSVFVRYIEKNVYLYDREHVTLLRSGQIDSAKCGH